MRIAELLRDARLETDRLSVEIPENWRQGRTAYGGLNTALAVTAARRSLGQLPALRAVQVTFLAPAHGRLSYDVALLRAGRSMSFVGVDCVAEAGLCLRAVLSFGAPRPSELAHVRALAPAVPAPADCPELPLVPGVTPAFLAELEIRPVGPGRPGSGGEPELLMWVRHRSAAGMSPEFAAILVGDVLPPAVTGARVGFHPASSVTWSVDLVDPPPDPGGWYLLESSSEQAADGLSMQTMRCFDAGGALVSSGRQTVAIF